MTGPMPRAENCWPVLPENHVLRVQGLANSVPLLPKEPNSPGNRRISIVVMNREALERVYLTTPEGGELPSEPTMPSISPSTAR